MNKKEEHIMKYLLAILVCGAECLAYVFICVLLGFKNLGGIFLFGILYFLLRWTWRSITRGGSSVSTTSTKNISDESTEDTK
jgi:membrane protein implicated in regulation of membrane protease activity